MTEDEVKKIVEDTLGKTHHQDCPHCGRCPVCGRGGAWTYPWNPYPWNPNQPWYEPYKVTWSLTSGTTTPSGTYVGGTSGDGFAK